MESEKVLNTVVPEPYRKFKLVAPGIIGEKRKPMLRNELLQRSALAETIKRRYTNYPGKNAMYGAPRAASSGTVSQALCGWPGYHFKPPQHKAKTARDFMALNIAGAEVGMLDAPQQSVYRATHDIRRPLKPPYKVPKMYVPPPGTVYGISTRSQNDFTDILEHKYRDMWIEQKLKEEIKKQKDIAEVRVYNGPDDDLLTTQASRNRAYKDPVKAPPRWGMKRFAKEKKDPNITSFRSEQAKSAAYKAHKFDGVPRRGLNKHGIYEPALN